MIELVKSQCKFCHKPLVLRCEAEYGDFGDPYKLVRLAACDWCADLRVRQRTIIDGLKHVVYLMGYGAPDEKLKEAARKLLKGYVRLASDWLKIDPAMDWDEAIVEDFLARKNKLGAVLSGIWKMARQQASQEKLL